MSSTISNTEDVIDSRDVTERAAELAAQWADCHNGGDSDPLTDEERAELDSLSALISQGEDYSEDWQYGATLIRDSHFQVYAMELADEMVDADGLQMSAAVWPFTCIDWEQAARELRMDYTAVDFDGVTYWVR